MYLTPSTTYTFVIADYLQENSLAEVSITVQFDNPCYNLFLSQLFYDGFNEQPFDVTNYQFLQYDESQNQILTTIQLGKTAQILIDPILNDAACLISDI